NLTVPLFMEHPFADVSARVPNPRVSAKRDVTSRCLEGLNVRPAFSAGVTARLSGQMSIAYYVCDKRGLCKAAPKRTLQLLRARERGRGAIQRGGAKAGAQLAKRDQLARRFIPEHQANAAKTLPQGQPADFCEIGVLAEHQRQPIERDA